MQDVTILFQTYLILLAMSLIVGIALAIARLLDKLGIIHLQEEYTFGSQLDEVYKDMLNGSIIDENYYRSKGYF